MRKIVRKTAPLLTLVTNKANTPTALYLPFIQRCVDAGISCVQLREKSLSDEELLHFGSALKNLLAAKNIHLIVNDNIELCVKLDAAGVHLGQTDGDPIAARSRLGAHKLIGLSVNNLAQVKNSALLPIDYIGVGAIFPTNNKPNIETIWGLDGLSQAALIASHPIVAIGGIDASNALAVMQAGATGIAAIGAFHNAKNPDLTTKNLLAIIQETRNDR